MAVHRHGEPSVDGRRARGDKTHRSILAAAVGIASREGLEGLSIGRLATELDMSKSGLFAHFGSKLELQLATVRAARSIFIDEVVRPIGDTDEGLARLAALVAAKLGYLQGEVFPGGCFFAAAEHEFDNRPGPVRDLIAAYKQEWVGALAQHARAAQARGELRAGADPEQIAFELDAAGTQANSLWQLGHDGRVFQRARTAVEHVLHAAATAKGRKVLNDAQARPRARRSSSRRSRSAASASPGS